MDARKRRAIAYIAGRLVTHQEYGVIYDFATRSYAYLSGKVSPSNVTVFDQDRDCRVTGSGTPQDIMLFDYGTLTHVRLRLLGSRFEAFDRETNKDIIGTVDGAAVTVRDHEDYCTYEYSLYVRVPFT